MKIGRWGLECARGAREYLALASYSATSTLRWVLSSLDPGGFLSFSLAMRIFLLADHQKQPMLSCIMHTTLTTT